MARKLVLSFLALFLLLSSSAILRGQEQVSQPIGLPENGTFTASDFDVINTQTGNLHIEIPLLQRKERGQVVNALSLVYDNEDWEGDLDCSFTEYCVTDTEPGPAMQWTIATGGFTTDMSWGGCVGFLPNMPFYVWQQFNIDVIDRNNTRHHMVPDASDRYQSNFSGWPYTPWPGGAPCVRMNDTTTIYAQDGSGISMDTGVGTILDDNGNATYTADPRLKDPGPTLPDGGNGFEDSNGNGLGPGGTLLDAAHPQSNLALYSYTQGSPSATETDITYIDPTGVAQIIKLTYAPQTVSHLPLAQGFFFDPPTDTTGNQETWVQPPGWSGSINLLQSISLPNGLSYQFTYDPNFADLRSVTLPTGGSISWDYASLDPSNYQDVGRPMRSRTVKAGVSDTEHVWTYSGQDPGIYGYQDQPAATSVTDPLGTVTSYGYDYYGNLISKNVTDSTGVLLAKQTSIVGFPSICGNNGISCAADLTRQRILSTDTTLPETNQVSRQTFDYDGIPVCNVAGDCHNIPLSQQISHTVSDYGSGAPGALLQDEEKTYLHIAGTGIIDRVLTRIVSGPTNGSSETWEYDNYGGAGIAATSSVPAHDYGDFSSSNTVRGNVTKHAVWDSTANVWRNTTYTFNDLGNVLTATDPRNNTTTYSYTDNPDSVSACTPSGNTQAYPTLITDPLGHRSKVQYNYCTGLVTERWDENQLEAGVDGTKYAYDFMKNMTDTRGPSVSYPGGNGNPEKTISYGGYQLPLTVTTTTVAAPDPPIISVVAHDGLGRVVSTVTNPSGPGSSSEVDSQYDAIGRVSFTSYPYAGTQVGGETFGYDGLDRKKSVTYVDGDSQTWSYSGNATISTDELGNSWTRSADALGRLTQVIEPGGLETDYKYDTLGNLTCVEQHGGLTGSGCSSPYSLDASSAWKVRRFKYDSLSHLLWAKNPESGVTCYGTGDGTVSGCQTNGYDANGNLLYKTNANGVVLDYGTYDATNRPSHQYASDGSVHDDYYYDQMFPGSSGIGHLTVADHAGVASNGFSYDLLGRLTNVSYAAPGSNGWQNGMNVVFNLAGGQREIDYPDGRAVTQTFDGAGRLGKVSSGGIDYVSDGASGQMAYTASGAPNSFTFGNGVTTSFHYNSRLQPDGIAANSSVLPPNQSGNPNVLYRTASYTNTGRPSSCGVSGQNNGNIYNITDVLNPTWTQGFSYDCLNRLQTAQRYDTAGYWHTYHYDGFGNLIVEDHSQENLYSQLSIDPATNRLNLTANTNPEYVYDAAGNLTSSGTSDIGGHQFIYNALSQVVGVDGYNTGSYLYDGMDERVWKQTASGWTDYVYLNGQPMAEMDQNGNWTDYIYANGKKVAKVETAPQVVHFGGTNCSSCTYSPVGYGFDLPAYTIQQGDRLVWLQKQTGDGGGCIVIGFTDGSFTMWDPDTTGGTNCLWSTLDTWTPRELDLSNYAGKTVDIGWMFENFYTTGGTSFEGFFSDAAIVSTAGSVFHFDHIYNGEPVVMGDGSPSGVTNQFFESQANPDNSPLVNTHYYLDDNLGTAQVELSAAGWPVWMGQFTPFGAELPDGYTSMHYKFTGKERDSENGLDYFGARYYGSSMGRWMSPDWSDAAVPIPFVNLSDPQSLNLYIYGGNNPLSALDPDGHNWFTEFAQGLADSTYRPIVHIVEHPIATAQGLGNAVAHPIATAQGIGTALKNTVVAAAHGDGRAIGQIVGTVGTAIAGGALARGVGVAGEVSADAGGYVAESTSITTSESVSLPTVSGGSGAVDTSGFGNVGGGSTTVENALTQADKYLGPGSKEIAPGVFRSADGTRQFRMTTGDIAGAHGNIGPHVHFESIGPDGRTITENSHVGLTNP